MIFLDVERVCKLRGIDNPFSFLRRNGFSHHYAKTLAAGARKSVNFNDLERLCRLLHCLPQDLLNYQPPNKKAGVIIDVLLPLVKKPSDGTGFNSLLRDLPPDEVLRLREEIRDRYRKPKTEDLPPIGPTD